VEKLENVGVVENELVVDGNEPLHKMQLASPRTRPFLPSHRIRFRHFLSPQKPSIFPIDLVNARANYYRRYLMPPFMLAEPTFIIRMARADIEGPHLDIPWFYDTT